jgi:hypothetical protein
MKLILVRTAYFKSGVWGCIYRDNKPVCATLERPFLLGDNGLTKVNESCVPTGTYKFEIVMRHKGQANSYLVPELQAVPGRSRIQIHIGNYIRDSLGCILVGTEMSNSGGDQAMILNSSKAFHRLMALKDEEGVPPPTVNPCTNSFQKSEIIIQDTAIQI